jgi:hypothetical protein
MGRKQPKEHIEKRMAHPNVQNSLFKKGHRQSVESRKKMSDASKNRVPWNKGLKGWRVGEKHNWMPKGKDHWAYKEDRSKIVRRNRSDPQANQWRKHIFERDHYKCRIADNNCNGQLEAHHILAWRDYPELRYQINNGITLCHAHHPRKRAEEKRLIPTFQELVTVSNV